MAPHRRRWGAFYIGVYEMTADTFRTVSTCFAAMFVSVLLVAASTSTALVA